MPLRRLSTRQNTRVLITTPANLNAIDGSSIWAQTIALTFASIDRVDVSLLLSNPQTTDRITRPLTAHPRVTLVDPFETGLAESDGPLSLDETARIVSLLATKRRQVVIVRGRELAERLAREPKPQGKLWPYLTDIPQRSPEITPESRASVEAIANSAGVMLYQTEELRNFVESNFEGTSGKGHLLPPTIPSDIEPGAPTPPSVDDLRLCYAGKFARHWNTYEMCELPALLRERGINATLTMVGDKINKDPDWPGFVEAMRERLATSPGVIWVGGVSRVEAIEHMRQAHLGLSWRSAVLDDSLELSTKLLEYCAAGTPPILNRTAMHERLFGSDYSFLVGADAPLADTLATAVEQPEIYSRALKNIRKISRDYTTRSVSDRLHSMFR